MPVPSPAETRDRFQEAVEAARLFGVPTLQEDTSWDFETYSEADIKKVGGSRYARHATTEVLMLTVEDSQGQVIQWVPALGEEVPDRLLHLLLDPTTSKQAWNARFELDIFEHVLGYASPLEEWKCVMVMAASQALPMDLATAGKVVGLPDEQLKMAEGKRLIKKFSCPRKPTKKDARTRVEPTDDPEDFALYLQYNRQDVATERAVLRRIRRWDMPAHEWHLWRIDQRINQAGIPINRAMVENAIRIYDDVFADRIARLRKVTGLENPNSGAQLLPWLQERGYPWPDLKKGHVKRALDDAEAGRLALAPDTVKVLRWRSEISRTSVKKYPALLEALDDDDKLRGCLQFCGAGRTWRWSGRRFQPQNLARPTPEYEPVIHYATDLVEHSFAWAIEQVHDTPIDLLSSCVRSVVQAPPGWEFQDADLNAIENRVLGWAADCEKILSVFREGKCPYLSFATYMYHQPYDALWAEYKAGNKEKRTNAKPAVLGAGYMLSGGQEKENIKTGELERTGLWGYADSMGIKMTQQQANDSVIVFRETFDDVVEMWWALDRAAREVITTGVPQRVGRVTFDKSGPYMRIHLPSGRCLHYLRPALIQKRTPWGKMRWQVSYEGKDQVTGKWTRITTHPGKITENIIQAIARDLLAHGMQLAHDVHGLRIVLHVHDQIVTLAGATESKETLEVLNQCLETQPPWALDMPLASDGFTDVIFRKD